ncbi:UBC-like protein [Daldinia caldariorum]|uniref:UBC-like protein n=1 Tax=Daldinia caldariorum TaxID=326644 RepID=UPI0020079D90|nr:UBC-like protein [Daldinia caldariorum]KAI1469690.1 UBC-like protein [Daldinia caldariorum]
MATAPFNSKSPTIRRILKEAAELSASPSADYTAAPLETDLFEWHFTLRGPPKSAFAGGMYHGRIVLPAAYPHRPPSFRFATPSGRFEANREICLSISGHHEDTWQPAWGVRTALVALRAFMETDARGQLGGLDTSDAVRRKLAADSAAWRCATCGKTNAEIMAECERRCAEMDAENGGRRKREGEEELVEVPAELKVGFRDEIEKARTAAGAAASAAGAGESEKEEDSESAELAEGFVQTAPRREDPSAAPRPAQAVPPPTRTIPLPPSGGVGQATSFQTPRRVDPNTGVPPWVDYAIVSLIILLIAMVTKVLIGR